MKMLYRALTTLTTEMNQIVQQCLDSHNEYRRKHGAPPLVINESLMRMAQNWAQTNANHCKMYHSSNNQAGENLYATSGGLGNGHDPVDSWYDEIKDYSFGGGIGSIFGFGRPTGHFTQVVWKGSRELGVGWATGRNGWTYFCCNYSPAGNYQGQYQVNVIPLGTPPPASCQPAPNQPSNSCSSAAPSLPMEDLDVNSFETRPLVRSSFNGAQPSEIVEAIFNGRLGNCMGDRMRRGYHLSTNQYLMSQNRQFAAILQEDGNFVIYKRDKGGQAEFATGTGEGANQVQLRNDGHITVVDKSKPESPLWKSRRNAEGGDCFLIMQDDGNLVGYKGTHDTSPSNAYFSAQNLNL